MGEAFGRYELLRRIGVGGMAEVFKANVFGPEGFVKEVVIKRILPAFSEDPDFVQMFINEARLAAKLQHANIVQIFDFNHVNGVYYIAMELVDGTDLKRVMDRARQRAMPVPMQASMHVAREALKGLHYASTRVSDGEALALVHRDISPHNLLVSLSGEVKITDFGIAKVAALASSTKSGVLKGKLAYMSPEQISGEEIDVRSDIFSLGIVVWELLTGTRLYRGAHEAELFTRVKNADISTPRAVNEEIPPDMASAVMKMLAADPDERYRTAAEALEALSVIGKVGGTMEMEDYIRALLPQEAGAALRGETRVMEGDGVGASRSITRASSAAPTRTMDADQARGERSDRAEIGDDADVLFPRQRGGPTRPRVRLAVLSAFCALAAAGWLISREVFTAGSGAGEVVTVRIVSEPPGASLRAGGVEQGSTPLVLHGYAGSTLNLEARLGARRASRREALRRSGEVKLILGPEARGSDPGRERRAGGAAVGPIVAKPATALPARPEPAVGRKPQERGPGARKRLPRSRGWGTVDFVVFPWATVKIDNKIVGQTPLLRHRLPEGRHRVQLFNREIDRRAIFSIKVRHGSHQVFRRKWEP